MANVSTKKVVLTSLIVDFSDFVFNILVAIFTGSSVMIAESLQGVADLLTVFFVWIGIKRSKKRANKDFDFGYGREIYFWTILSGFMMLAVTATLSFYFGLQRFLHPEPIHNILFAYIILVFGLISNSYAFLLSVKKLRSADPKEGIWESFFYSDVVEIKNTFVLDLMGSVSAFFGFFSLIIYWLTGDARYDGAGAMIIGVSIAIFATVLIAGVKDFIIGKSANPEIEEEIQKYTLAISGVEKVDEMKTMHIGTEKILLNLWVSLADSVDDDDLIEKVQEIKTSIRKNCPLVKHIQVEVTQ